MNIIPAAGSPLLDEHLLSSQSADGAPVSLLHIDAASTSIVTFDKNGDTVIVELDAGFESLSSRFFHHTPPTPDEVEYAINLVEDELTAAYRVIRPGSVLVTHDPFVQTIAGFAGLDSSAGFVLSRTAAEEVFTRFAKLSMGSFTEMDRSLVDGVFYAKLLILREVQHHLGFDDVMKC